MKMLVLWSQLSDYFLADLAELSTRGWEIHIVHFPPQLDAPFQIEELIPTGVRTYSFDSLSSNALCELHRSVRPDAVLASGWQIKKYRKVLKLDDSIRILAMDNPWKGTLKQKLGTMAKGFLIKPYFDMVFLPGERQRYFAHKLGFRPENIVTGFYSANVSMFRTKVRGDLKVRAEFLFVGRLVKEKGLHDLFRAYGKYREEVNDPWNLRICGTGPEEENLSTQPGVIFDGFVNPQQLPAKYRGAGCFVLPSHSESWGVVLHEATLSGLPIICSNICGATPHLVEDRWNGYVFPARNVEKLSEALRSIHGLSADQLAEYGARSHQIADRYSPQLWADKIEAAVRGFVQ